MAVLLLAPSALAAKASAPCKAGASQAAYWTCVATSGDLAARLEKVALPKKARRHLTLRKKLAKGVRNVQSGVTTLGNRLESAAGLRTRQAGLSIGQPTVTTGPNGLDASATLTYDDPSSTTSSSVDINLHVPPDGSSIEIGIGGTVTDKKTGKSKSNSMSFPISFKPDGNPVCPTATGDITRSGTTKFTYVTKQVKPEPLVDFINETVGYEGKLTMVGKVSRDAKLQSLKYQFTGALDWSFNARGLLGIVKVNRHMTINVDQSGTVNPTTGAISAGKGTLTPSKVSQKGLTFISDKELATQGTDGVRSSLERLVADTLGYQFKDFKTAEAKWQTPNTCATLALDPGAGGELADGATANVKGTVKAKDGTAADGDWTLTSVSPGSVSGLPGSSSAAAPVALTMTAGTAAAGQPSVNAAVLATSPAGVASGTWQATAPEDTTLYYRIVGATASQTANGTLSASSGCVSGPTAAVGPWTFAFGKTTGEPDGSIEREGRSISGLLRASGDSMRPAWTWKQTCPDGSSSAAKEPITYSGQFGPTVTFSEVSGDASTVAVGWYVLSPPPVLDHQMVGPSCTPVSTTPNFQSTVPLATLRQTTPFTLTHHTDWTVDVTRANGHTVCTGITDASLTPQRVKADGSPLQGS